jgi:hypothetical protein
MHSFFSPWKPKQNCGDTCPKPNIILGEASRDVRIDLAANPASDKPSGVPMQVSASLRSAFVNRQSTVCKIEQTIRHRRYIITYMDIEDKDLREIGPEAAELRLRVLRAHLISIAEADRAYWSEKVHSRDDASEYQKRQERLNEIRMEMMTLTPGSMQ